MRQKVDVFDLEKPLMARCAAKQIDPDRMSDADREALTMSVLNEIIETENRTGFRVSLIPHTDPFDPVRFLCNEEQISSPQHAMLLHLWKDQDLAGMKPEYRNAATDLRVQEELRKLNAARIAADGIAIFNVCGGVYLFLITHDA